MIAYTHTLPLEGNTHLSYHAFLVQSAVSLKEKAKDCFVIVPQSLQSSKTQCGYSAYLIYTIVQIKFYTNQFKSSYTQVIIMSDNNFINGKHIITANGEQKNQKRSRKATKAKRYRKHIKKRNDE